MKQITIYDLLPLLKEGWVAMDENGKWCFFNYLPTIYNEKFGNMLDRVELYSAFNIEPFDGDWKDSLIKVEHKCSSKCASKCASSGKVKEEE